MSMDINSRSKSVEDLDLYLSEKQKILSFICCGVGWIEESLHDEIKVQCPYDPGHWIPESSLAHHVEMCTLLKDGYSKEEIKKQPPDSTFFYQKASSVVSFTMDKETQANILVEKGLINRKPLDEMPDVPKTVDRWTVELNPEQRLAEYDYVIEKAKSSNKSENDTLEDLMFDFEKKNEQDDRPKTQLEIMAEQRDYKRRRQSYRAKNVHITKKSYTEIMKEVIENQITLLSDMRKEEDNEKDSTLEERKHKRKKRERSPGFGEPSQDTQRRSSRDRHHSRNKRSRSRTPKKKKHKYDRSRSRSRSRSRKHKKSHRKHKKSHD